MYLLYTILLSLGLAASLPYWLVQMALRGKYRAGIGERLGRVPARLAAPQKPAIWIHAVSVGEVLAVIDLTPALSQRFPSHEIFVSTTTQTGQTLARARLDSAHVFYFPLDLPFAIRPYLRRLRPQLVMMAETEFWPNFLRLSKQQGARVAVINARISDRSLPGYLRYRGWMQPVLQHVDLFVAQTDEDARRLVAIGAAAERVQVGGNLKFDAAPPPPAPVVEQMRAALRQENAWPVLVCGSTLEGEEPLLLKAFENLLVSYPRAVMVLAPRRPERFAEVAALVEKLGIRLWRRSRWRGEGLASGVLLLDSIGELAPMYGVATIAFVGGSLVERGGHNIIEPAQYAAPIVVGPHTGNFRDIVGLFQHRDAVKVVGPAELPLVFMELLASELERNALGLRAAETLASQKGATGRTLEAIARLLSAAGGSPDGAQESATLHSR